MLPSVSTPTKESMLVQAFRRLGPKSPVTNSILEAGQIADWIVEQMEQTYLNNLEGKCEAASYDISGNCWKYFTEFSSKFSNKEKLVKLVDGRTEYLHAEDLGLNDFDALILAKALKFKSPHVKLLDLNNNPDLGNMGMAHICRHVLAASSPVNLRSLFLSNCGISNEGISSLIQPLRYAEQSLHILELRNNEISDEGVEELAEALSIQSVKTPDFTLFLSGNRAIGEKGAVALCKAVVESEGRLKVWLKNTCESVSQEDKKELMRFAKNHLKF